MEFKVRDRTDTPRIARMLRELQDSDGAQNRSVDIGKPAIDCSGHSPKQTAQKGFIVAAALIAVVFVVLIAWQMRSIKMAGAVVTTAAAKTNAGSTQTLLPCGLIATLTGQA